MAYEYEIKIPMWLEDGRWLNMNVDDEVLDELEEVYRKAKAMGEIEQAYWKSDTPENFAYDFVRIFEKRFSNRKGGE